MKQNRRIPVLARFFIGTGRLITLLLWWLLLLIVVEGILRLIPELHETLVADYVSRVVEPGTSVIHDFFLLFGVEPIIGKTNVSLPIFFIVVLVVRNSLARRLNNLEFYLSRRTLMKTINASSEGSSSTATPLNKSDRRAAERRVALKRYNDARAILESTTLKLTFVSIDVVDSTGLKKDQDRYVIEQTFSDYRALVEEQLDKNHVYKATWTPDGQMAAFRTADEGVAFGKNMLTKLDEFNKSTSKIDKPFRVRIGINTGEVSTDDKTPMVEISDFSVDLAGHLQKYAEPDTIWASEETYNNLENKSGFKQIDERVDERVVYEWTPATE